MKWLSLQILTILSILAFSSAYLFDIYKQLIVNSIRAKFVSQLTSDEIDLKISFPKTKWCGPGNTALNYDDLGEDQDTDNCCREHDHCPISLDPGKEMFGIRNTRLFAM